MSLFFFFFQAEDGIRDAQESRGLGDVYKRQEPPLPVAFREAAVGLGHAVSRADGAPMAHPPKGLSLIHI